jgi:hypothetical protein
MGVSDFPTLKVNLFVYHYQKLKTRGLLWANRQNDSRLVLYSHTLELKSNAQ